MDVLELTRKLISINSEAGVEATYQEIASFVHQTLMAEGLESELVVCPVEGQEIAPGWDLERLERGQVPGQGQASSAVEGMFAVPRVPKYNVVASYGSGRPHLVLHAHLDTVPCPLAELWQYPPFAGQITQDRLYGLGAADNKSGVAIALGALLGALPELKRGRVTLCFTADEELGGYAGAGYLTRQKLLEADMIISTNGMLQKITLGYWGRLWASVRAEDEAIYEVLGARIDALNEHLQRARLPLQAVRMVCFADKLEIVFNIFSLDGFELQQLTDVLHLFLAREDFAIEYEYLLRPQSGKSDQHVHIFSETVFRTLGFRVPVEPGAPGDLRFMMLNGVNGVAFGPLRPDSKNHQPNEHVRIEDVLTCTKILTEYLLQELS